MIEKNELKILHHWPILALSCIDGRFIKRTIDFLGKEAGAVFDYRTEVGCSKALLDCDEDCKRFFNIIEVSVRLHGIEEVWLIDHIDCGAYGGSKSFSSEAEEREFHASRLRQAADKVREKFPSLGVKAIFAGWETIKEL
jgi:carbonic anhydrase